MLNLTRKFSTNKLLCAPAREEKIKQDPVSKWSESTPSVSKDFKSLEPTPVFSNDKMKIDDKIENDLKKLGYPTDRKVVDAVADKHFAERNSHIAAYEAELEQDTINEITDIRKQRLQSKITDTQHDRFVRKADKICNEDKREHAEACEKENELTRRKLAHYKESHCVDSPSNAQTADAQNPTSNNDNTSNNKRKRDSSDRDDPSSGNAGPSNSAPANPEPESSNSSNPSFNSRIVIFMSFLGGLLDKIVEAINDIFPFL